MSLRDAIDNFYERLVLDAIEATRQADDTADYLTDVLCVALNHLPNRYYRHSIDMMFYLADEELGEMKARSLTAVRSARDFVTEHRREPDSASQR
ncbi:late competence development ComFB family protein [Marinobacter sp. C2H3]|uniref:late competence development ComFB family protein n=1 Tax=Marinobacter sp. C2H3 TaxID=3119003 RepID=UPI00300F3C96